MGAGLLTDENNNSNLNVLSLNMARYTEAKCKLCRREGTKLYLKGNKCLSSKCTVEKRPGGPGMHPAKGRMSGYGKQFREKQKVKRIYGVLEAQFRRFYSMAAKDKMQTGAKLLQLLERRLDNVMHRMGVTESRNQARQMINHGHVTVNGTKVSAPSFLVKVGDEIVFLKETVAKDMVTEMQSNAKNIKVPQWIEVSEFGHAKITKLPDRSMIDQNVSEQLIVEYYSR